MGNNIVVIVFSKNRAMQLSLCLETFFKNVDGGDFDVKCLYKVDEKHRKSYELLDFQYSESVEFIEETNFRENLLEAIDGYYKTMFVVDDCIFTSKFNLQQASDIMDYYPKILGVSFRLGINTKYCYSLSQPQSIPAFIQRYVGKYQDFLGYEWPSANGDFQYALELSSSMYRTSNIKHIFDRVDFPNPNMCEWVLYCNLGIFVNALPILICYENSVAFCNPVNRVQNVNNNKAGNDYYYDADELLINFENGYRIDNKKFEGFISNSCHQEVILDFVKRGD